MPFIQHRHILLLFYFIWLRLGIVCAWISWRIHSYLVIAIYTHDRFLFSVSAAQRHILFPHCHFTLDSFINTDFEYTRANTNENQKLIAYGQRNTTRRKKKTTKHVKQYDQTLYDLRFLSLCYLFFLLLRSFRKYIYWNELSHAFNVLISLYNCRLIFNIDCARSRIRWIFWTVLCLHLTLIPNHAHWKCLLIIESSLCCNINNQHGMRWWIKKKKKKLSMKYYKNRIHEISMSCVRYILGVYIIDFYTVF